MRQATITDKSAVVQILSQSFDDNKSVNYIVRQDARRGNRIRGLMEYAFLTCLDFGKVFIAEGGEYSTLVLFPDRKRTSLKSIWRDLKLVCAVTGLDLLSKVLKREALINQRHPADRKIYYIWFIGVLPAYQGKGLGTRLMEILLADAQRTNRTIYLETSTTVNVPWYEKFGFSVFDELDFGYPLYFLKRPVNLE